MKSQPKVSVIMPVYNAAAYLPAALESVLGQSLQEIELIAIDDGSTDATLHELRKLHKEQHCPDALGRTFRGIQGLAAK